MVNILGGGGGEGGYIDWGIHMSSRNYEESDYGHDLDLTNFMFHILWELGA